VVSQHSVFRHWLPNDIIELVGDREGLPGVECPKCGHRLGFYPEFRFWKCTNCGKIWTYDELPKVSVKGGGKVEQAKPKKSRRVPKIVGIILAYVLAIVVLIVVVGPFSFIPLWLLLGVSLIYSIEKWLTHYTGKYKIVGWIYRLILNLSVLSLLGFLISSGVLLFTQRLMQSPLIGSLVFLAELAVFIWLCRIVSKNSWRQPSMRLTVFSLICLFLIFSFAGVQPMAHYKDVAIDKIRMIRPESPALSTVILVLAAIGLVALFVDGIRRKESSFSMKKAFLILLVIVCIAVVVWTAYLLFTGQTDPIMGWIILAVDIGVLFWNISVLRAYRVGSGTVVAVFLVVALIGMTVGAFAGIEPFAGIKNKLIDSLAGVTTTYDVDIPPGQIREVENWKFSLNGGGWKGGTLTVQLTITNLGSRRCFGELGPCLWSGPELAAIDSTGKLVEPWVPEPDFSKGQLLSLPAYTREFYPNESWTGTLKFELSPYSGETGLYMTENYAIRKYFLFDVGEPKR